VEKQTQHILAEVNIKVKRLQQDYEETIERVRMAAKQKLADVLAAALAAKQVRSYSMSLNVIIR